LHNTDDDTAPAPVVIPHSRHSIHRDQISASALKVVHTLTDAGFAAYLVGGCVRDLLLGREPKDFDVVTDALPEEISDLFRSARIIGRRFRLVHVRAGRDIIEVSTFRALSGADDEADDRALSEGGRVLRDNVYGTRAEDALRRDFTVNALYLDLADFSIVDYVNGVQDVEQGVLRMIGDAETRYREDPVRMLRALRFAAKLGFRLEHATEAPLHELARLLGDVPAARLFEEVLKLFHGGAALETFELLRHYGLFAYLFPLTEQALAEQVGDFPRTLIPRALANTDARMQQNKPVNPAFLFAVFLWHPCQNLAARYRAEGMQPADALSRASQEVVSHQVAHISIPRRYSTPMREIWAMQPRLERRAGKRAFLLLEHPRFRAAYDFMLLRVEDGEADAELATWWTRFQEVDDSERRAMVSQLGAAGTVGRKKRRRRRSSPRGG
jgi:poly(A) polymerase